MNIDTRHSFGIRQREGVDVQRRKGIQLYLAYAETKKRQFPMKVQDST